jgi:gliding motility-associated-like protein
MIIADPATQCLAGSSATSNHIKMTVQEGGTTPTVSIKASDQDICEGANVTFTATAANTGTAPTYQWQLNGANVGTNTSTYSNNTLKQGDQVSCMLTTVARGCATSYTVTSNKETVNVTPPPVISFTPSELNATKGEQLQLNPVVSGDIASFEWTSNGGSLENPQLLTPTTGPLTTNATYQLRVVTENGCTATGAIVVKVSGVSNVVNKFYLPNSFTPNGDGKNDVFRIPPGVQLQLREFSVFDRWGKRVFTTKDASEGWDGSLQGRQLNPGVFVWTCRYQLDGEAEKVEKGTVILVR